MVFLAGIDQSGSFNERDTQRICSNTKEARFFQEHGDDLLKIIGKKEVLVTPHVIAEVCNKIKSENFDLRRILHEDNTIIKLLMSRGKELHLSLKQLFGDDKFRNHKDLGVTDCALMILARQTDVLLLTQDRELKEVATSEGVDAMLPQDVFFSVMNYSSA
jgi:predicted nucleic acid-binding protein